MKYEYIVLDEQGEVYPEDAREIVTAIESYEDLAETAAEYYFDESPMKNGEVVIIGLYIDATHVGDYMVICEIEPAFHAKYIRG